MALGLGRSREPTAAQLRRLMISQFRDWLGSRTNRNGRPFQADTISAYADAAIARDARMTAEDVDGDFTVMRPHTASAAAAAGRQLEGR